MEQIEKEFQWFWDPIRDHYFNFDGRATRQAYWMFTLWWIIIYMVVSFFSEEAAGLLSLAVLLPSLSLGARRLHDVGMSGWWQLIWVIPVIGWIVLIVFLVKQGVTGPNEYGDDPRAIAGVPTPVPQIPVAPSQDATPTDSEVR